MTIFVVKHGIQKAIFGLAAKQKQIVKTCIICCFFQRWQYDKKGLKRCVALHAKFM